MYSQAYNYYSVLGLNLNASTEEVKKAYRDIALTCHPDKLIHIKDDDEKKRRVEKFKEATKAYEILMNSNKNQYENIAWADDTKWNNMWNTFFGDVTTEDYKNTTNILKDAFVDIATSFIKNKIYPKQYYNPSSNLNKVIDHDIKLLVTYDEVKNNVKKKLRLILINIDEPIFLDVYCGSYPEIVREYTDENDCEHEIKIRMEFIENEEYSHISSSAGKIDLVKIIEINLLEYISGCEKDIKYIDNKPLTISIPPFQKEFYEINDKGIFGGSLILNIKLKNIEFDNWNNLIDKDKHNMLRILNLMYKMI